MEEEGTRSSVSLGFGVWAAKKGGQHENLKLLIPHASQPGKERQGAMMPTERAFRVEIPLHSTNYKRYSRPTRERLILAKHHQKQQPDSGAARAVISSCLLRSCLEASVAVYGGGGGTDGRMDS